MKNLSYVLTVLGLVILIIFLISKNGFLVPQNPTPTPPTDNTVVTSTPKPIELCFAKFGQLVSNPNGFEDKYILRLSMLGDQATGELKFLPAEKDRKVGKFTGTVSAVDKYMMARTASLWWEAMQEGMSTKEELSIIFGEGTASIGFGAMVDRGDGVYVYKDKSKIDYSSLNLTDVSCDDLTERDNVESYVRTNINKISPVKPVLGGTWYALSVNIDPAKNSGNVTYEDGHLQEKKTFTYVVDEKGGVVSLTIN